MRKFKLLSLLLVVISFITINCTKEGPEGPAGSAGPQGPAGGTGAAGPAGAIGSANVIYSNWIDESTLSWADTTIVTAPHQRAILRPISLTQAIVDNGTILMYRRFNPTNGVEQMPYNLYFSANSTTFHNYKYVASVGRLISFRANSLLGVFQSPVGIANLGSLRYILIPGSVLGGRSAGIGGTNYTADQVKAMSYNEVCNLFSIPQ